MRLSSRLSLTQQNAVLLAVIFILFEFLVAAAVVYYLMLPMARRSANDLAGLMILSAQTWAELPPDTRIAFEYELWRSHALALRAEPPEGAPMARPGEPYVRFLYDALRARVGQPVAAAREEIGEDTWFWVALPAGRDYLSVGFPHSRIGTRPLYALAASLAGAVLLTVFAAWWLAHRATRPLARLEQAVMSLGQGQTPERLPETGPREIATLSRRFNEMAKQVEDLLAARTVLLAGVSHDLRTPLARLRLAVEMLVRMPSPELAAQVESDVEAMDRLIADTLMLVRGFDRQVAERVDVQEFLRELAGEVAAQRGLVEIDAPALVLTAPRGALQRILQNLLENALRYGAGGTVTLRAVADAGGCRIGVLDRGPGIPAEAREAVFQPFVRLEASRSVNTGGSGLGLAIVRQLATAQGWRVVFRDRPGGGLEAWLEIPGHCGP
ncbi:MAG: ATP-binding protein [Thiobacillus sp.]